MWVVYMTWIVKMEYGADLVGRQVDGGMSSVKSRADSVNQMMNRVTLKVDMVGGSFAYEIVKKWGGTDIEIDVIESEISFQNV